MRVRMTSTDVTTFEVMNSLGILCFSIDAELAWGFHDLNDKKFSMEKHARKGQREAYPKLISIFEEFDIPATWAFVGHLFLDKCDGKHSDLIVPSKNWLRRDPGSNLEKAPLWYGRDLVEQVLDSSVKHEIGCHSFTHVTFDNSHVTAAVVDSELRKCVEVAKELGVRMKSFVFPRDKMGYLDTLNKHGFSICRGKWQGDSFPDNKIGELKRALTLAIGRYKSPLIDATSRTMSSRGTSSLRNSLIVLPSSNSFPLCYRSPRITKILELIPFFDPWVKNTQVSIDKAINQGKILHVWFHPWVFQKRIQFDRLRRILHNADVKRDEGSLKITTMGDIASINLENRQKNAT